MGIRNLYKFLESKGTIIERKKLDTFKDRKIAIDASMVLYQIIISIRNSGDDLRNKNGEPVSHLLGLFYKTCKFLENNLLPIYVFDGRPPKIKDKIVEARRNSKLRALEKQTVALTEDERIKYFKRSTVLSKLQIDDCKELLTKMGLPYVQAPEEADSQCAYLAQQGFVDAVYTEDMDILTFGSPILIKGLKFKRKSFEEISLRRVLDNFELSYEQFVELCILFGSDYSEGLRKIDVFEIYEIYKKQGTMEKTIDFCKETNKLAKDFDSQMIYDYYLNPNVERDIIKLELQEIEYDNLFSFLVKKNNLLKSKVEKQLLSLKNNNKIKLRKNNT